MSAKDQFQTSVPALRMGTVEPPLTLTDVSLRQGGVFRRWPVPVVPHQFPKLEPIAGEACDEH